MSVTPFIRKLASFLEKKTRQCLAWLFKDGVTFFTVVLALATLFLAHATYKLAQITKSTDARLEQVGHAGDELARVTRSSDARLEQERIYHARDNFDAALDEAEKCCRNCPACTSPYLLKIPIDKAVRWEHEAAALLTAAEYNELARLGSKVLDFPTTEGYIKKAMATSNQPLDKFFSHLVLGHIHFLYLKSDPAHARLEAARDNFKKATDSLHTDDDTTRFYLGRGWGLWAAHERLLHNSEESQTYYECAKAKWSGLPEYDDLVRSLYDQIEEAGCKGIEPDIACLFKPVQPVEGHPLPCPICTGEVASTSASPKAPPVPHTAPAPPSAPTPAPPLKEPGSSAPKAPAEAARIPSKEVALFDVSEFFRKMHSLSSDDVVACREFIDRWNNQVVHWRVFVHYITPPNSSYPYLAVTQVPTCANVSVSTGAVVVPLELPVYVTRDRVPTELQRVFDVLKYSDTLWIEGTLEDRPKKDMLFIVPSKIIRVR